MSNSPSVSVRGLKLTPFHVLLVVLITGVYALAFFRYYVGWFTDDTAYIIGAQSLLQGRYAALHQPGAPVLTQFPPGYPLFLAPWVLLVQGHWALLKIPSFILILLSGILLWKIVEGWLTKNSAAAVCLLFFLSPLTVPQAGVVMSEPFYLFLSLLAFYLWRLSLKERSAGWIPWVWGGILGWAAITRTIGLLLFPSILICLIFEKRWRTIAKITPLAVLPPIGVAFYNATQAGTASVHLELLEKAFLALSREGILAWLDHLQRTGYFFFSYGIAGMSFPYTGWTLVLNLLMIVSLVGLAGLGMKRLSDSKPVFRPLGAGMCLYSAGYLMIHSFWIALDNRFVFPLLPFLLILIVSGCVRAGAYVTRPRALMISLVLVVISTYTRQHLVFAKAIFSPPGLYNLFPKNTFTWMRQHLPENSVVLYAKDSLQYLYTGFPSVMGIPAGDIEEFRYRLLRQGVQYALSQPFTIVEVPGVPHISLRNLRWIALWPSAFPILYADAQEHTILYRIAPDAAYLKAYELYESAEGALAQGDYRRSQSLLEAALKRYPALSNAENAYGSVLLLGSKNTVRAEKHYKRALSIRPHFTIALINLARIYRQRGQVSLAVDTYQKALQAIAVSGEAPELEPVIRQESAILRTDLGT